MIATYAGPELYEDIQFDVKCGLERLLAARNAIALGGKVSALFSFYILDTLEL